MKYKKVIYKNDVYIRINEKKAMNLLKNNKKITLYVLPINADPNNEWINGFFEVEQDSPYTDYIDSINTINEIRYYNCVDELGSYLKYYIKMED